jgi:hypothetical protein
LAAARSARLNKPIPCSAARSCLEPTSRSSGGIGADAMGH